MKKSMIRPFAILLVKYLQNRYRTISVRNMFNQTNSVINKLILIQSVIYYFKQQFSAYGYFHPDCTWSEIDEQRFRKLFPEKDHYEIDLVVHYNPEAITYYKNKIYNLKGQRRTNYSKEIKKQLQEWKNWN